MSRFAFFMISAASACACTSTSDAIDVAGSDDAGTSGATDAMPYFTADERATITTWLGPLSEHPPPDPSNAWADDPAAAALGQRLFFDAGLSANGKIACATCHDPRAGFSDGRSNTSQGLGPTPRASMSVLNAAWGSAAPDAEAWQYWDGRADSQWAQALGPLESPVEMGTTRTAVALRLYDGYRADYEAVFGALPTLRDAEGAAIVDVAALPGTAAWEAIDPAVRAAIDRAFANTGKAIAAYERELVSRDSRFDRLWAELASGADDSDALSDVEKLGLRTFIGRGRCLGCHGGPNFTDGQFHDIAVPQIGDNVPAADDGRAAGLAHALADPFNCSGAFSDHPDKARCAVASITAAAGEPGAFKTPSLRGVSATAPYMHTGGFASLADVVAHYDLGGGAPGSFTGVRDELIRPLGLSSAERDALVQFLLALDGAALPETLTTPP